MAEVKVPPLLHKMSVSSQKAWYKKNKMELPGHLSGAEGKSAAQAKKDVGDINKEKAARLKTIAAAAQKVSSDRVREMARRRRESGEGLGGGLQTNRDIVGYVRAGGYLKAGRLGEEVEQIEEVANAFDDHGGVGVDNVIALKKPIGKYTHAYVKGLHWGPKGVKLTVNLHHKDTQPADRRYGPEHEITDHKSYTKVQNPGRLHLEEVEQVDEAATQPSDKELRMARGIAFGKRYKGGNMTAAVSAIEKIRSGLSDHPQIAKVLRRANEEKEMSHGKLLAKKVMTKQSTHPIAQNMGEENVVEEKDEHEYGYEGDMAKSQLKSIIANAQKLHDMLEPETDLPEWVQSKITLAEDYVVTAANYCAGDLDESVNEEVEQVDEDDLSVRTLYSKYVDQQAAGKNSKPVEKAITKVHGAKVMSHLKRAVRANLKGNTDSEENHFEKARDAAGGSDTIGSTVGRNRSAFRKSMGEEVEQVEEKYMGFKAVEKAVAAKGARNPAAVAAAIGRKKYGKEKFQAMAAAGKKQANEETVVEASEGKTPETETEVNLAKKHGDPKKITYGDVIKARIESAKKKALTKGE